MRRFKTTDEDKFNKFVYFLVTKGVTFEATTENDLYIVQLTGGF